MEWFSGDFDNYRQVLDDRRNGLFPKDGGGHEHFHCTLVPVNATTRLAAFYFDGNPNRIFRFRFYEFVVGQEADQEEEDGEQLSSSSIEMRLYTLHPELEALLRSHADTPSMWRSLFLDFDPVSSAATAASATSNITTNTTMTSSLLPKLSILPQCEIAWSTKKDPVQHSYIPDIPERDERDNTTSTTRSMSSLTTTTTTLSPVHAVMVHGEAIVNSTMIPGMKIRIVDQLSLYEDTFYINDRGFDPTSGDYIYGNQRDVPYILQRVSRLVLTDDVTSSTTSNSDTTESNCSKHKSTCQVFDHREIVDPGLEWTLGPQWRSKEEYDKKIELIGGPSTGIKPSSS
jgi:hypothetical protein